MWDDEDGEIMVGLDAEKALVDALPYSPFVRNISIPDPNDELYARNRADYERWCISQGIPPDDLFGVAPMTAPTGKIFRLRMPTDPDPVHENMHDIAFYNMCGFFQQIVVKLANIFKKDV